MAVWVGVSAAHRGEAFDACRYIIDEVKHRLPDLEERALSERRFRLGELRALRGGAAHAHHTSTRARPSAMQPDYSRQIPSRKSARPARRALARSRVLIVGAGGLGVR